jgi:hypothetical protein
VLVTSENDGAVPGKKQDFSRLLKNAVLRPNFRMLAMVTTGQRTVDRPPGS